MGKCINHPDRETSYLCMKHQVYLCEECLRCMDPKLYCKHRQGCPIWFMSKRKGSLDGEDRKAAAATCKVAFEHNDRTVEISAGATLLNESRNLQAK